jgi:hypothetical protein
MPTCLRETQTITLKNYICCRRELHNGHTATQNEDRHCHQCAYPDAEQGTAVSWLWWGSTARACTEVTTSNIPAWGLHLSQG